MICLSHIECYPVWDKEEVILFDMYHEGTWIGSRRLLRYCEEVNSSYASEVKVPLIR